MAPSLLGYFNLPSFEMMNVSCLIYVVVFNMNVHMYKLVQSFALSQMRD